MKMNVEIVSGLLMIVVGALGLAYAFSKTLVIQNTGHVHNNGIDVYWCDNLTDPVTKIDWGTMTPNSATTKNVWLHNLGNMPILVNWTTANWSPDEAKTRAN